MYYQNSIARPLPPTYLSPAFLSIRIFPSHPSNKAPRSSFAACWSLLNLSLKDLPQTTGLHLLPRISFQRDRPWCRSPHSPGVWLQCHAPLNPQRQSFLPSSLPRVVPHSQRKVWKAQRGCFSKVSPNLRTRSRWSKCLGPRAPFILMPRVSLGLRRAARAANSASEWWMQKPQARNKIDSAHRPLSRASSVLIGCLEKYATPLGEGPASRPLLPAGLTP